MRSETETHKLFLSLCASVDHIEAAYRHLIWCDLHLQALAAGARVSCWLECDLPCREHYYLGEGFNTGAAATRASTAGDAGQNASLSFVQKKQQQRAVRLQPVGRRTCCRSDLSPPHFVGSPFRDHFSTGPRWPSTQRAGPASGNYTMQMPFRPFNTAGVVSPQLVRRLSPAAHAHLWSREKRGGGIICSFIHVDISSLCVPFHVCLSLFTASSANLKFTELKKLLPLLFLFILLSF